MTTNNLTIKTSNIFLTLERQTIRGYFNKHDPSPLYKRQLNHYFETYIFESVKNNKREEPIFYKLNCRSEEDKKFAEPLMYAIKRHFSSRKADKEKDFKKFKRKNYILLLISILIVIIVQGVLPLLLDVSPGLHTGLLNSIDIFAWVLLWHPIDELVFHWNEHLKQICLLDKLANAQSIIIESEQAVQGDGTIRIVA